MTRNRYLVVVVLLILILLVASVLFGMLTYWLDMSALVKPLPGERGVGPAGQASPPYPVCCLADEPEGGKWAG